MIKLVCNYCDVVGDFMYGLIVMSVINDRIHEDDMSQGATHLHFECIVPWAELQAAVRARNEEVPF